ncbi:UNVERIFIED_ORG: putative nuclease with TOPRIM domain [Methylobacterium sp. SuP10 SLI 274]|uniref:hypothetical protein n=1 Tax=Methylorubrum extorquens TaxID=408 RepID=UPI00209E5CBC|nr:hypothetical protein [Methylorubrum extorquens]MDF9864029.1 putative nuclease with TOPRIM domain [Methylorubrum pseudosasae]MDH6637622.1 putative nuclease with TOPRIM domain [Methylobacterium sp. SuP10 SLI 274]MDH6666802.1 putative nuclease with TOPRIM domain [Methylorubrum zatmanii]MCP1558709.1 putative nuclease with TOPRIM domain [Methylorubrum extorquens]MDF9792340.1 putative nuclease with TOPRIM domain [Methylorubrum extorquens]
MWNDYVAIFQKCEETSAIAPAFISDVVGCDNVTKLGHASTSKRVEATEDMRALADARQKSIENDAYRQHSENLQIELNFARERLAQLEAANAVLNDELRALKKNECETEIAGE